MLISAINISNYDDHRFVVNTAAGRNILVDGNTIELLDILRNERSIEEACTSFNKNLNVSLNLDEFTALVNQNLGGYGILLNEDPIAKKTSGQSYLKARINIIPPNVAGKLSAPFTYFFKPILFYTLLSFMLMFSVFTIKYFFVEHLKVITPNFSLLSLLICMTMLVHELGHIAACRRYNIRHGAIGFGIYAVIPVAFADISNIWQASRNKRIMANLGGIFCEYLYAFALLLIYSVTDNPTFLLAHVIIASKAILELNPFIRLDGYWVLSDLTSTPNLLAKARGVLKLAFKTNQDSNSAGMKNLFSKHTFLIAYGVMNYAVMLLYMILIWSTYKQAILSFPETLRLLVQRVWHLDVSLGDFKWAYLMVLLFYYLLMQYSLNYIFLPIFKKAKEYLK